MTGEDQRTDNPSARGKSTGTLARGRIPGRVLSFRHLKQGAGIHGPKNRRFRRRLRSAKVTEFSWVGKERFLVARQRAQPSRHRSR